MLAWLDYDTNILAYASLEEAVKLYLNRVV